VYLGLDDFPFGLAQTQKVRLVSRALLHEGCKVTVLSRWWSVWKWKEVPSFPAEGEYEGIHYIHACGHVHRPQGWFYRKIVRLRGLGRELSTIVRLRRSGLLDIVILSSWSSPRVLYYVLLSRILGFPLIMHLVEYYASYTANGSWKDKLNARLLDQASMRLVDGVLPISTFLINRVERHAPGLPWLRDPGLVDLKRYDGLRRKPSNRYFAFCGYLGYMEVIRFCLHAFEQAKTEPDVELHLVVNGAKEDFERLEDEMRNLKKADRVVTYSGISDREVSKIYINAYALLIPLRPTDQDRARFPHKIGEYCGSGRPIITTDVGEVACRFTHGVNAYVTQNYDLAEYAAAIEECLADPARADAVGAAGRKLAEGTNHFTCFGPLLKRFVLNIAARHRDKRS
jgi:glycosyltransferase involved in cell wall biosynthesis